VQSRLRRPLNDFHGVQPNGVDVTILAPSLLSADFARIAQQIACVQEAGAQYLHLDVMDGRFVPNITWGPKIIGDLRRLSPLVFDAHLMIVEPERYVDDFREAGCDRITFHLEATPHAQRLLVHLRAMGVKAGIAICPQTPVAMLQDVIENCDTVLVMSVNPGFSGQKFITHAIEKVREARALIDGCNVECLIEVDGGVGEGNARALVEAGADALVMGATVFGAPDPAAALRRIRALLA